MIVFNCKCGKKLQVKDELGGKKVKCPTCGEPLAVPMPEPSQIDLLPLDDHRPAVSPTSAPPAGQKSAPRGANEAPAQPITPGYCPTCQSKLSKDDVICHTCGTMIKQVGKKVVYQTEEVITPGMKMKAYLTIIIGVLIFAAIAIYFLTKEPAEEKGKGKKPKSTSGQTKDGKPGEAGDKAAKPEDNLRREIKNGDLMLMEDMLNLMVSMQSKALGVLSAELSSPDAAVRLKAAHGLYFFSYFKCFRKDVFNTLDRNLKPADEKTRLLVLEMLYLLQTDAPDMGLLSLGNIMDQQAARFKDVPTSPTVPAGSAKFLIQKFNNDKDDLIKAKALIYLITMGDRSLVKSLFPILKSESAEAVSMINAYLSALTGQSFEKPEEWEAWYKDNKDKLNPPKK